jgi:hypothetical protein
MRLSEFLFWHQVSFKPGKQISGGPQRSLLTTSPSTILAGAYYCEIKKVSQGDEFDENDGNTINCLSAPRDIGKDGIFLSSNNYIKLFSRWIT